MKIVFVVFSMLSNILTNVAGYSLHHIIGEGGQGVVRLGINIEGQKVAVKIATKRLALQKEIKIHSSIRHENIIQILQAIEDNVNELVL